MKKNRRSIAKRQYGSSGLGKRILKNYDLYLLMLIPLVFVIIFHYLPMYGVQIAFRDYKVSEGITGSKWVGLKWFIKFFTSYKAINVIKNTFKISFYGVTAGYFSTLLLALGIHNLVGKFMRKSIQMITYAPYFISMVVMCGMVMQFLHPRLGIINKLIMIVGLEPISFLSRPDLFSHVFVWSGIWQAAGWGTIIYLAALAGVNPVLHEAAVVDGASKLQRIIHVDLPSILPTATIILILEIGNIMNVGFEKAILLQNTLNISASEVIQTYSYKVGLASTYNNFSYGAAIGLFNSVITLLLIITANAAAKKMGGTSLW